MKRAALLAGPLALFAVAPVLPLAGQDIKERPPQAEVDAQEPFPWPDFLEFDPLPGQYRWVMTVEGFDMPFIEGDGGLDLATMTETDEYCLAGDVERIDWFEDFGGETCTQRNLTRNGDSFSVTTQCRTELNEGAITTIIMSGDASEEGMDMVMNMRMSDPEMGKISMRMRFDLQRTGECE